MEYNIDYDHMKINLGIESLPYSFENNAKEYAFKKVKESADKYKLELSDEEFEILYKIQLREKDADWIMRVMSQHKSSLARALMHYICY